MKLKLLLSGILFLALSCSENKSKTENDNTKATEEKENPETKKESSSDVKPLFGIKAAKIVFNYTGGAEQGTETFYFDDYGAVAVLVIDKKSKYTVNNQTIIWKDKKSTLINHDTKKVANSPFRPKDTEPPGIADISASSRNGIGYEKIADKTIAGKNCEVWFNKKMNIKYYLWNKIDLKLENQGVYVKEATSVEEISAIPASLFEIPGSYNQ